LAEYKQLKEGCDADGPGTCFVCKHGKAFYQYGLRGSFPVLYVLENYICGPPCLASCCRCPAWLAKRGAQPQILARLSGANCAGPIGNP
jgi:hypothetical protein